MPVTREKNDLDKKWTWFLFLGANVLVVLGCAITWALFKNGTASTAFVPMLVGNLLGIVLAGLFMYFESKEIAPKAMHYQKKWMYFYLAAFITFIVAILFNVLFFIFELNKYPQKWFNNGMAWQLWVYFIITMVLTLVSIGLQRYARFRIDLDVYRRKHGENPNQNNDQKNGENQAKNNAKNDEKNQPKNDQKNPEKNDPKSKASGGLLDQM